VNNSNDALSQELQKNDVGEETTLALRSTFMPMFEEANTIAKTAKGIVVTSEDQTDKMDAAREMRLAIKAIRVDADKKRKALKEDVVRKGKAIDGLANIIKFLIVPIEEHLQKQEDFVKLREQKRKLELVEVRSKELREFDMSETDIACHNLGEMSEELYQVLRDSWQLIVERKLQVELEAEKQRIADKKAEVEERARLALENEKLKSEREESEKISKGKLVKERAKFKYEREERERLEAAIEAKKQAEKKERNEIEESFRKAGLAPDKEKLEVLAVEITRISCPRMEGEARAIAGEAIRKLNEIAVYIRFECLNL